MHDAIDGTKSKICKLNDVFREMYVSTIVFSSKYV